MAAMVFLESPDLTGKMPRKASDQRRKIGASIAPKDHQVPEASQDQKDQEGCLETTDQTDNQANQAQLDHKDQGDQTDQEEIQAQQANPENQAFKSRYLDHQDHRDHQDLKDHQANKAHLEEMANPDDRDHVVHQARMAKMVLQARMVRTETKARPVPKDQKGAATTAHLPEQLQAIKPATAVDENDPKLELPIPHSIQLSIISTTFRQCFFLLSLYFRNSQHHKWSSMTTLHTIALPLPVVFF